MVQFDVLRYRDAINLAVQESYLDLKRQLSGQHLYGFSIYMHPLGTCVSACLQSEEGLDRVAQTYVDSGRYQLENGDLFEALRILLRWNCADDWLIADESHFVEVNNIIDRSFESNWEEFTNAGCTQLVYLQNMAALVENRAKGLFTDQPHLVLNLYCGDQSDQELLAWANQVNTTEAYDVYKKELNDGTVVGQQLIKTNKNE